MGKHSLPSSRWFRPPLMLLLAQCSRAIASARSMVRVTAQAGATGLARLSRMRTSSRSLHKGSSLSLRPLRRRPGLFLPRWAVVLGLPILAALQLSSLRQPSSPLAAAAGASKSAPLKVQVLNATETAGLEEKVAEKLRASGYDVVAVGSMTHRHATTTFLYQGDIDPAMGKDLAELLGAGTGGRAAGAQDPAIQVSVIIGADYRG